MKKITEYHLVTECDADKLAALVNDYIDDGWQPHGSVTTCVDENHIYYGQAMVRYDD